MEALLALSLGAIAAAATYLLLSRNLLRVAVGLIMLSNGVNLFLFLAGRTRSLVPPIIDHVTGMVGEGAANPLPQALILTAIVISFGLTVYALALVARVQLAFGKIDSESLRLSDSGIPNSSALGRQR